MNAGVLLHVRPDEAAITLPDDLRSDGLRVVESPPGGEAIAKALESDVDAALIDTTIESPLVVARMIHRTKPEAHIVFLTDDRTEPHLRRELLIAPRKGAYRDYADFHDRATDAEIVDFHRTCARICAERGVTATGFRAIANAGADAVQEVPHFHLHLIGGRPLGRMLARVDPTP